MNDYAQEISDLLTKIREDVKRELLEAMGAVSADDRRKAEKKGRAMWRRLSKSQTATPRAATPRPKGAKRSPEDIEALARNLLAYVKKNSGQRIEQIAAGLSVATGDLALPAKKLLAEKKLKTAGQKRGTTYQAR